MSCCADPALPRARGCFMIPQRNFGGWAGMLRTGVVLALASFCGVLSPPSATAGEMERDPGGFYGIRWGAKLADVPELVQVEAGDRLQTYEFKHGAPLLGDARPDSVRLIAIHGQFARATVRYRGAQTHGQILAYLEREFGRADRTPGSMIRGLNQEFNWRGSDTEVNLTYEGFGERGIIFIESRTLAPRFNDVIPEHGY
jgi:hypothetical protein